ncbi:putative CRM domain-containing protein At3g25440, chloroplastic [Silene latifolia]|uniref:putative CRM domain-containing protein At3g25440, chloroplastic n=1 Tax=Silene latifolia TaxID=37657 RepID=UPI003D77102B
MSPFLRKSHRIFSFSSLPHLFHSNSYFVKYSTPSSSNLSRGLYDRTLYDLRGSNMFRIFDGGTRLLGVGELSSNSCVGIKAGTDGVVRFSIGDSLNDRCLKRSSKDECKGRMMVEEVEKKKKKVSKKRKVNELRFYRLKAKKKMKSPNPAVRIRYKLEKAKRKEAWLIEKLRKFELPKAPAETYDPESLTEEEKFYLKRTGEKKKHYVPVGRRGVFGGVVLNMHLHWKNHETVKVVCKPCRPGQVNEIAEELSQLSKGTVIDIKPDNTVIFYRGKNYVQPEVMSPPDTLSKAKALEKYKYQQSLEHTSQFIEKLEKELEEYQEHLARYRKGKDSA